MSSNLGNKETMAKNIKYYMDLKGVNSADMCHVLDVPQSTFSYWLNAKTYPRIDKIEKMANYFGVSKAALVEEHGAQLYELAKQTVEEQRLLTLWRKADGIDKQTIWNILSRYEEETAERSSTG